MVVDVRSAIRSYGWMGFKIIGADFQTAKDLFRFVTSIKAILAKRQSENPSAGHLFLLINNAAQTLTNPVAAERKSVLHETHLRQLRLDKPPFVENNRMKFQSVVVC